jgi:hypothetical protein
VNWPAGWWLVAGGWWLVARGWWLVARGWWLDYPITQSPNHSITQSPITRSYNVAVVADRGNPTGGSTMANREQRSNREKKKPKQPKKAPGPMTPGARLPGK